ncbi:predicted protein [Naegleria gruberi]|uniref:Predicted protein n=1 Tax=Naegleria gruberi TaxID=5762 RepID=D2VLS6_NAEGR|nr:uncharacterized protein NAEGRDRAFT_69885 [Naegleria gruberi]EFC42195.1 predicted protein [Naegleria gruberi]|eukprot:XP_002674939.1 predicted protein [Naegleria gruberi strain NEG-M]
MHQCNHDLVVLILYDFLSQHHHNDHYLYSNLKKRFENQSKGKYKWLINRFTILNFIPIEYSKDKQYIMQFLDDFHDRNKHSNNDADRLWENIHPQLLENDFEIVEKVFRICKPDSWQTVATLRNLYQIHKKSFVLQIVRKDGLALKELKNFNDDRNVVLESIKNNEKAISFVNKELMKNREFIFECVRNNGLILPLLSNHYQYDRQVALQALSNNATVFKLVKEKLCRDRNFVMDAVRENGRVMEYVIDSQFSKDREIILLAMKQIANNCNENYSWRKMALTCVKRGAYSIVLRLDECVNDIEIVIESIRQNGLECNRITNEQSAISLLNKLFEILEWLSKDLKNDKSILTEIISHTLKVVSHAEGAKLANSGLSATLFSCINNLLDETNVKQHQDLVLQIFKIISCLIDSSPFNSKQLISRIWNKSWETDNDFVYQIVESNYQFFHLITMKQKNDRIFMLKILRLYPQCLEDASLFLRNSRSFMLEAIKECPIEIFSEIETMLIEDRDFALETVSYNGYYLEYFPDFWNDREVVLKAVESEGDALEFVCEDLVQDREIVLTAVRNRGCSLEFASPKLQQDRQIVLESVKNDPEVLSFHFLNENLRSDKEIILAGLKTNFFSIPDDLKRKFKNDREFILEAVKQSIIPLKHTCSILKDDLEIMKLAVMTDPTVIELASERVRNCKEIALIVVSLRGDLLKFLSVEMRNDRDVVLAAIRNKADSIYFASNDLIQDNLCILEAIRNGLSCSFFITHQASITMDLEMVLEALKRNECGICALLKQLLSPLVEMKEEIAMKSGFCCEFSEELFQKRICTTYLDACYLK